MGVSITRGKRLHFVGDSLTAFGWYSAPGALVDQITAVGPPAPSAVSSPGIAGPGKVAGEKTIVSGTQAFTVAALPAGPYVNVSAFGVGGNRIHDLITDTVPLRILAFNPDIVFMEFGINDWTNSTAQASFQADYASALDQVIAWKPTVQIVCLSTYFHGEEWQVAVSGPQIGQNVWLSTYGNVYDSTIATLCAARPANCTYVDLATPAAAYVAALTPPPPGNAFGIISDSGGMLVHPNLNGQIKMGNFVMPSLSIS